MTRPKPEGGPGLRAMKQLNSACLSKLGWRILHEGESLWTRILESKYSRDRQGLDMFQAKPGDSLTWRRIVENTQIIQQGTGWAIGDGRCAKFWNHKWAMRTTLLDFATLDAPMNAHNNSLSNYWDEERGWR